MSMFFVVTATGRFDQSGRYWDEGLTEYSSPIHKTKTEARSMSKKGTDLNKATCPKVQEIGALETHGVRSVTLLVKAMGYQEAYERAKEFCDTWYQKKKTPKSKQVSYKDLPKKQSRSKAREIFEALPRAMARMGAFNKDYEFEYYTEENRRNNGKSRSGRSFKTVS